MTLLEFVAKLKVTSHTIGHWESVYYIECPPYMSKKELEDLISAMQTVVRNHCA